MKLLFSSLFFLILLPCTGLIYGQSQPVHPSNIGTGVYHGLTPPVWGMPVMTDEEYREMKESALEKQLNEKNIGTYFPFKDISLPRGHDLVWQNYGGANRSEAGIQRIFQGQTTGMYPPDANGAVGPEHYIQTINTIFSIYNKSGDLLAGPFPLTRLFAGVPGGSCDNGDPIVLYDEPADRWLVSQMSLCDGVDRIVVAVSASNNPLMSWHQYSFVVAHIPDYPKFGIWQDGYYFGTNTIYEFDTTWICGGDDIYVLERSQMLTGGTAQIVSFDNPWRPGPPECQFHVVPPADNEGAWAPAGSPALFITFNDDAVGGGSDQLWLYELDVDWVNPPASTFNRIQQIDVAAFDSELGDLHEGIITQPGTSQKLAALAMVVMNRPQYRNFGSYQAIVCCHSVDVSGTNQAGIRWYELRKTTGSWFIRQQGTYAPGSDHRWMGSIALNGNNEIGLAYSISSSSVYPGIRYCGQSSSEYANASGIMDIAENTIKAGTMSQTDYHRWGDYSDLSVDPANDEIFWFTTEYSGLPGEHHTQIASFQISTSNLDADFACDNLNPSLNDIVTFHDYSLGNVTSRNWIFSPASVQYMNGTSSVSQIPQVKFLDGGLYTVKLKVSDGSSQDSIAKDNYIHICHINSLPFNEDFSDGYIPDCWKTYSLAENHNNWMFTNPMSRTLYSSTAYNGFALFDADLYGDTSLSILESPILDLSSYTDVYLYFEHYFYKASAYPEFGKVYFSNNGGLSWTLLAQWSSTTSNPNYYNSDVSVFVAGYPAVKFRWEYSFQGPYWAGWWAVDDIWITGNTSLPPVANFYSDDLRPVVDQTVHLYDYSSNSPASWNWSISPHDKVFLNGTDSTYRNPVVAFNDGGYYTVSLTVTNSNGSDTETKTDYLYVMSPGLWRGYLSSDWLHPSNWDDGVIPGTSLNATIPVSASNWPVFNGLFEVGVNAQNLVLLGGSEMTVNGTLLIDPQKVLMIADSGTLHVSDYFFDYGWFYPGMGMVEFFGSNPSYYYGTDWETMYVNHYQWGAFVATMTQLAGASSGPSGDDSYMDVPIGFDFNYCGTTYNQASICTNGWCSLILSGIASYTNEDLFTDFAPNGTLAPWWDDLNTDGLSSVNYKTEGTSPDRVFTVEWNRMLTYYTGASSRISFQLKLYESSNIIEFIYGPYESGSYNPFQGASIGLEDEIGGAGHYIDGHDGSMTTGAINLQSHADWPGIIGYRFTPPSVSGDFYKLKINKADSFLKMNRDANVQKSVHVEDRSEIIIPASKNITVEGQ